MISEQVMELRDWAISLKSDQEEMLADVISQAADTIEELSAKLEAANAEKSDGGWILCEDRLPEIMKPVLVCDRQGNVCVRAIACKIKGKKHWSQDKYDVVAWKPLPEPYNPDRS